MSNSQWLDNFLAVRKLVAQMGWLQRLVGNTSIQVVDGDEQAYWFTVTDKGITPQQNSDVFLRKIVEWAVERGAEITFKSGEIVCLYIDREEESVQGILGLVNWLSEVFCEDIEMDVWDDTEFVETVTIEELENESHA